MRCTPSVVPDTACEVYLVLDDFGGNIGKAWRETIEANTKRGALVRGLLEGLYVCPTRIVAFNMGEGWCRDATIDIACELSDICVNMDQVPECVADLIAEYASGEDCQPKGEQGDAKLT
jgi:hypothetical protein